MQYRPPFADKDDYFSWRTHSNLYLSVITPVVTKYIRSNCSAWVFLLFFEHPFSLGLILFFHFCSLFILSLIFTLSSRSLYTLAICLWTTRSHLAIGNFCRVWLNVVFCSMLFITLSQSESLGLMKLCLEWEHSCCVRRLVNENSYTFKSGSCFDITLIVRRQLTPKSSRRLSSPPSTCLCLHLSSVARV